MAESRPAKRDAGRPEAQAPQVPPSGSQPDAGLPEAPPVPQPAIIERDQLIGEFVTVYCSNLARCCQKAGLDYDGSVCGRDGQGAVTTWFESWGLASALYDGAAAARCKEAYAAELLDCEKPDLYALAPCASIFSGTSPVGAACTRSGDCAKSSNGIAYCWITIPLIGNDGGVGTVTGVCAAGAKRGKSGETCNGNCSQQNPVRCAAPTGSSTLCHAEDGLTCTYEPSDNSLTCAPFAHVGQPCTNNCAPSAFCEEGTCMPKRNGGSCAMNLDACLDDAYCDETSQCRPKEPIGARCAGSPACASLTCQYGPVSDPTNGVCIAKPTIASPEACSGKPM